MVRFKQRYLLIRMYREGGTAGVEAGEIKNAMKRVRFVCFVFVRVVWGEARLIV